MAVTLAVLVKVPVTEGSTLTTVATVATAPFNTVPNAQVTTPPASLQVPWLGVAEIKLTSAGNGSVSVTPVASEGPLFVTVMV